MCSGVAGRKLYHKELLTAGISVPVTRLVILPAIVHNKEAYVEGSMTVYILLRVSILCFLIIILHAPAALIHPKALADKLVYKLTVENKSSLIIRPQFINVLEPDYIEPGEKQTFTYDIPVYYENTMGYVRITDKKCGFTMTSHVFMAPETKNHLIVVRDSSFSKEPIPEKCKFKKPIGPSAAISNYHGTWICPGRGWLKLYQQYTADAVLITGTFGGKENEAWGVGNVKGGTVKGAVKGDEMDITFFNNDGTYTTALVYQGRDPSSFSGKWKWYKKDGTSKGSGTWGCNRK